MNIRRNFLNLLLCAALILMTVPNGVFADETSVDYLLNYDANAVSGESGYIDLSKKADYGIKENNTLIWSVVNESVFGRGTLRFSPRKAGSDSVTSYGKFVFDDDTVHSPQPLDDTNAAYMLEMEVSSILRNASGAYYYTVMGKDNSGNDCEILKLKTYGSGTEGHITADGVSGANEIPVHLSNSGNVNGGSGSPAGLYYIRMSIDLYTQTYSVWVVKRADGNNYTAAEPSDSDLIVADAPMNTKVSKISAVDFGAALNVSGDKVNLSFLRVSRVDDQTILDEALQSLTEDAIKLENSSLDKVSSDLNLPRKFQSADVTWEIADELQDYLSKDGIVTVPEDGEEAVTGSITAVLKRGDAEPVTKTFTVTIVPGSEKSEGVITSNAGNKVNQAMGAAITGTSEFNASFSADKAIDGSTSTRWATPNSENTKVESLTFDFGDTTEIDYFTVNEFYNSGIKRTEKCITEISDNGTDWMEYENTFTDNGVSGQNRKFTLEFPDTVQSRYFKVSFIRSEACGENGISVWEIEAYKNGSDSIDAIKAADEALNPAEWLGENSGVKAIKTDLSLPADADGMPITWSSSAPEILAADGTVSRPLDSNKRVVLTAKFSSAPNGTYTCEHRFTFVVLTYDEAERNELMNEALEEVLGGILVNNGSADAIDASLKVKDWSVASKYGFDVTITADSSLADVIDMETGAVTRPYEKVSGKLTINIHSDDFGDEYDQASELQITVLPLTKDNLAYNCKAESDSVTPLDGAAENAVDDRAKTKWQTGDLSQTPKLTVNLGSIKEISCVELYEVPDGNGGYLVQEAEIEVSEDGKTYTSAAKLTGVGEQKTVDFVPVKARYVRYSVLKKKDGNTGLYEFKIFNNPTDENSVAADKLALKWPLDSVVTKAVELPGEVQNGHGSKLVWTSSDDSIFKITTENGKIIGTPKQGTSSARVTVKVTFSKGDASDVTEGMITVPAKTTGGSGGGGGNSSGGSAASGRPAIVPPVNDTDSDLTDHTKTSPYSDVSVNDWAYDYIVRLTDAGIVSGDGSGQFYPQKSVTREELVKMVLSALKIEPVSGENQFKDVADDAWYSGYIKAASDLNIIKGKDENAFGINEPVSRQDMVTVIYRAFEAMGYEYGNVTAKAFEDADEIKDYAAEAVNTLSGMGIIDGTDGKFNPDGKATREQTAKVICMIIDLL